MYIIIINVCYYGGAITIYATGPPYSNKSQSQTRNKSNAYFEAIQYRQDVFPILPPNVHLASSESDVGLEEGKY